MIEFAEGIAAGIVGAAAVVAWLLQRGTLRVVRAEEVFVVNKDWAVEDAVDQAGERQRKVRLIEACGVVTPEELHAIRAGAPAPWGAGDPRFTIREREYLSNYWDGRDVPTGGM